MDTQQNFWDHLDELRSRLIKAIVGVVITSLLAYSQWEKIWAILVYPLGKQNLAVNLIAISPLETLLVSVKISVISGILLGFPWVMWQAWLFFGPAFFEREKKLFLTAFSGSVVMFAIGAAFCYFVVLPAGLGFLATYMEGAVEQHWKQSDYAAFTGQFLLAFGVIFELPVIAFVLGRLELVTPRAMWSFFRYAIILIFIIAAVLTPGPDPVSQLLMAIPMCFLYFVSIGVCALAYRGDKDSQPAKKPAKQEAKA